MVPVRLKFAPHIDGLRAVAVLSVIGFHAFPHAVTGGFVGVDIFFVISGFLISSILYPEFHQAGWKRGAGVIMDFYSRRVRRIFPSLIVVLIGCFIIGFFVLDPSELATLSLNIDASAGFFLNYILSAKAGYFDGSSASNPLLHLWSLSVEEQFYLLWPMAIWLILRCRMRILPAVVFFAATSYFWNALKFQRTAASAFFLPEMRFGELLIGAAAAVIFPLIPQGRGAGGKEDGEAGILPRSEYAALSNVLSVLGLGLIGAALFKIRTDVTYPNTLALLPTVGTALVVCSGGSAWTNRHLLSNPILVWIGAISYPLYLWHWPLLSFALIDGDDTRSIPVKMAALLASVVLAWITYRLVETPIRHGRKLRLTAALVAAMAVVAGLALYSKSTAGFPSRFPPLINAISSFRYDPSIPWREGTYFLMSDEDETRFPSDPDEIIKGKATLYLWGDSHAAALYPGVKSVYGRKFNIVQRTAAAVPPFLAARINPGNGQQIGQFVLDSIRRDHPEYVLLHASWQGYQWEYVEETILALKKSGIHHVVLVGPVPQWGVGLPQQLYSYYRKHRNEPLPLRMNFGADHEPVRIDGLMASMARRLGIEYISPCTILGGPDGFLVRTGDTPESLTAFDYGHLTASGSEYLVSHFPKF